MDDYGQLHQQAHTAYVQGNYEVAATLVDQVVVNLPNDPNIHLLRGHIYYVQQQYDVAREEYQRVLELTKDPEMIEFANNGLESLNQVTGAAESETVFDVSEDFADLTLNKADQLHTRENTAILADLTDHDFIPAIDETDLDSKSEHSFGNPFGDLDDPTGSKKEHTSVFDDDPFGLHHQDNSFSTTENFTPSGHDFNGNGKSPHNHGIFALGDSVLDDHSIDSTFEESDFLKSKNILHNSTSSEHTFLHNSEDETLLMGQNPINQHTPPKDHSADNSPAKQPTSFEFDRVKNQEENGFHADDGFDFAAFESAFGSESIATSGDLGSPSLGQGRNSNIEFLDDFDEFDDLGNIPGFDLTEDSTFGEIPISAGSNTKTNSQFVFDQSEITSHERDNELFSITGSSEAVPAFAQTNSSRIEPQASVEQGWLAFLENSSLEKKKWVTAGTVGIVSALVVAAVSCIATNLSPAQQRDGLQKTGWAMALFSGVAGFATTAVMTDLTIKQMRKTTDDLQHQFDSVREGNLNAQAIVYSEDEFGRLSTGFNEMTRVILATTTEAQRKAQEQEEAKENLQRQVIRLLDDVEGAARGDLTVQAEVTADVLGAVADAFNLTISSSRSH
jgi:twitching motility protein PilJ